MVEWHAVARYGTRLPPSAGAVTELYLTENNAIRTLFQHAQLRCRLRGGKIERAAVLAESFFVARVEMA